MKISIHEASILEKFNAQIKVSDFFISEDKFLVIFLNDLCLLSLSHLLLLSALPEPLLLKLKHLGIGLRSPVLWWHPLGVLHLVFEAFFLYLLYHVGTLTCIGLVSMSLGDLAVLRLIIVFFVRFFTTNAADLEELVWQHEWARHLAEGA